MALNKKKLDEKKKKKAAAPPPAALEKKPKQQALAKMVSASMVVMDAGAGQENMQRDDFAIPRITILQALSPQVDKHDERFVEDAEAGMIFDTVSHELTDGEEGIIVVPVSYRRTYIEWKPRKKGGGFVKDHGRDEAVLIGCTRDPDTGRDVSPGGNDIVTTAEYFCFLVNEENGDVKRVLISMSSTQLKKAKRWNTLINQLQVPHPIRAGETFNPAMFFKAYKFTTTPESNDKGNWIGWVIEPYQNTLDMNRGDAIYLEARGFKKSVDSGEVKAADPTSEAPISDSDAI